MKFLLLKAFQEPAFEYFRRKEKCSYIPNHQQLLEEYSVYLSWIDLLLFLAIVCSQQELIKKQRS
jgi:hypothetical protein